MITLFYFVIRGKFATDFVGYIWFAKNPDNLYITHKIFLI